MKIICICLFEILLQSVIYDAWSLVWSLSGKKNLFLLYVFELLNIIGILIFLFKY